MPPWPRTCSPPICPGCCGGCLRSWASSWCWSTPPPTTPTPTASSGCGGPCAARSPTPTSASSSRTCSPTPTGGPTRSPQPRCCRRSAARSHPTSSPLTRRNSTMRHELPGSILASRELRATAVRTGACGDPAGHAGLRAAIARHVGVSRGVRANAADVIITNGMQQAIDLIGRVLLDPGACVAVEDPGYPPARRLFESLGARVVSIPVDDEGLVVDSQPGDARLVYVSPSHQYPLGMAMSLRRRIALLAWAAQQSAAIIEDDYDSEFRFAGHPIEPLHSLDRDGRVIYVGSFSKSLLPTLRLGFLVAPPSLGRPLRAAKCLSDWHTSLPPQAALARFIDEGKLARHVRKMRVAYQARHRRITDVLGRDFAGVLEPIPSAAGLHLSAIYRAGTAADTLSAARRAEGVGVLVSTLSEFTAEVAPPGLVLGYGAIPLDRIDEGLRRLGACLHEPASAPG